MNRNNLDTLISHLETSLASHTGLYGLVGFNMATFIDVHSTGSYDKVDSCGTVGCIAGWCAIIEHGEEVLKAAFERDAQATDNNYGSMVTQSRMGLWKAQPSERKAAAWLGLSPNEADALFMARNVGKSLDEISAEEALKVLKYLRKTGEVDWSIIRNDYRLSGWMYAVANYSTKLGLVEWRRKAEEAYAEEQAKRESYDREDNGQLENNDNDSEDE